MAQPDERRAYKRYRVKGVRGSFLFSTDARVIDLSLDGMAIETGNPLKVGREYLLKLEEGEQLLPLRGVVVWCSLVKTRRDEAGDVQPVYRAGVHFEDVMSGKASQLRNFIHKSAVVSLENRLFGRFRIDEEKSANLGLEARFLVHQLSLAGMLVEADVAPAVDAECHMEIRLKDVRFDTMARIARVERIPATAGEDEEEASYFLGIEFTEMDPDQLLKLEDFIRSGFE